MKKTVVVGMSGGVDSALSAALLVEQGYDVRGVYMRNWSRDLPGYACPWAADLADAERVAVSLGIPLDVWDCETDYQATVVDYLIDSYRQGLTPNPDVMCNQTIKFGTFAERALAEGADFIATGHYARTEHAQDPSDPARLMRSADAHKDQTYFLWRVGGQVLNHVLFPIGGIESKAQVREMCAERSLEVASKPDSDGICFIGPVGLRTFLLDSLEQRPGDIVEWETGNILGRHDGAFMFTVGQRRGLDLGGGPARYVVSTDTTNNVVYVTSNINCEGLWTESLDLMECCWVAGKAPQSGTYLVRTRHTGELTQGELTCNLDGTATIRWPEARRSVAPGQSAVIYDGEICLGGGIVAASNLPVPPYATCAL